MTDLLAATDSGLPERSRILARKDVMFCDLAAGAALLDMRSNIYYGLNGSGAKVWQLIQTPATSAEIRDALCRDYDVEPARCADDLETLLRGLISADLVILSDDPD